MSQPFEDNGEKEKSRRQSNVNRSATSKIPSPGMLGIDKGDFNRHDNSEVLAKKNKQKNQDDATFTSGTPASKRPSSGNRSGARRGVKDEVRADLKR